MKSKILLIEDFTIGADIECFVRNQVGEIVSAEPYIKGTKHEPFNFDPSDKFFAVSLDNVLSEYCIPPVRNSADFVRNINKSLGYINSILPEGFSTVAIPSAVLDASYLQSDAAKLFGCESDYNAWLRQVNKKPIAENQNLRSAGFHVHVGYKNPTIESAEAGVKAMDVFLSLPSILIEPDNERRKLYGKAGAFRVKPYGFEHRVLSGYFGSSDELKAWVYENTEAAIDYVNKFGTDELDSIDELIQNAINNNDKNAAENLIRQFNVAMI